MKYIMTLLTITTVLCGCGNTKESLVNFAKGKKAFMKRDFKIAEDYFLKCIDLDGAMSNAFVMLAKIKYYQKDFKKAQNYISEALAHEEYHVDALYWKARILTQLADKDIRDYEVIINCLKKVLVYNESNTKARFLLALTYERINKLKQALYEYKRIKKQEHVFVYSRSNLARLYDKVGLKKLAQVEIDSAIALAKMIQVPTDRLVEIKSDIGKRK